VRGTLRSIHELTDDDTPIRDDQRTEYLSREIVRRDLAVSRSPRADGLRERSPLDDRTARRSLRHTARRAATGLDSADSERRQFAARWPRPRNTGSRS